MIEITIKGLRYCWHVAHELEESPEQVALLKEIENREVEAGTQVCSISRDLAIFCAETCETFLCEPGHFDGEDWDGNDWVFLQSLAQTLRERLAA